MTHRASYGSLTKRPICAERIPVSVGGIRIDKSASREYEVQVRSANRFSENP